MTPAGTEQTFVATSSGATPDRHALGKLLDPYYQPLGVAGVYAVVLPLDAALAVDLLSWVVCIGAALTLLLLIRGVARLARGGIESDVARVASEESGGSPP